MIDTYVIKIIIGKFLQFKIAIFCNLQLCFLQFTVVFSAIYSCIFGKFTEINSTNLLKQVWPLASVNLHNLHK